MLKSIDDFPMFRIARLSSEHSEFDHRFRIGAVLSRKGIPFSIGFNKFKTHAKYPKAYSLHAEMDALNRVRYPENMFLWVYRETADGWPALAKPCHLCMPHIIENGIRRIYYSMVEYPHFGIIEL